MQIDKDVPVPVYGQGMYASNVRGRQPKYPWKQMVAGDSFFVPEEELPKSRHVSLKGCARREFGKGNYTIRKEANGYRVWRLA